MNGEEFLKDTELMNLVTPGVILRGRGKEERKNFSYRHYPLLYFLNYEQYIIMYYLSNLRHNSISHSI